MVWWAVSPDMENEHPHRPPAAHSLERTVGVALLVVAAIVASVVAVSTPRTAVTVVVTVLAMHGFHRLQAFVTSASQESGVDRSRGAPQ